MIDRAATVVAMLLLVAAGVPRAEAQEAGPDASGLRIFPTPFQLLEPPADALDLGLGDSDEADVELPWVFPYYGLGYEVVRVSANGALRFGAGGHIADANSCIPSPTWTAAEAPDVAVYWDDLVSGSNGRVLAWLDTVRSAFVLSWNRMRIPGEGSGTFQVRLFPNGEMELHFEDIQFGNSSMSMGGSATVGVQDLSGGTWLDGHALLVSCDQDDVLAERAALVVTRCVDEDGDGERDAACGGTDCDDEDPNRGSGLEEVCDGIDTNCDGFALPTEVDTDADGWLACVDCDDTNSQVHPFAPELCNGRDDDCDGFAGSTDVVLDPTGGFVGAERLRGTLWRMDEDVVLGGVDVLVDAPAGTTLTYLVYESDAPGGPFERVLGILGATEGLGERWQRSPPLGVLLEAGRYYVTAVYNQEALGYSWTEGPELPLPGAFGEAITGIKQDHLQGPPLILNPELVERLYTQRLIFLDELDGDGDGALQCRDCDDGDPNRGQDLPELCDGEDRDCDGLVDLADPDCASPPEAPTAPSPPADEIESLNEDGCQASCEGTGIYFGALGGGGAPLFALLGVPWLRRRRPMTLH